MKKKITGFFMCMLLILTILPQATLAGDPENPEIEDEIEEDIVDNMDIISAWFYEKSDQPDYLFVGLKLKEINTTPLKQHLTVHWEYNGIPCATMMAVGYQEVEVVDFSAGWGHGFWFQENYQLIEGEYNQETGTIIMEIPKSIIKDPKKGDVLTNTYALTFQRFGFIGSLGFDRAILQIMLQILTGKSRADVGPNEGYGRDYILQY
ncbi:MAG: hypothetical protein V1769_00720 [Thermoplasmatota archaeon]